MSAKQNPAGGAVREMRRAAADRYKVLNHLFEKSAFSRSSAVTLAELKRATGLEDFDIEWVVGTTAMADMAIVEIADHRDSPLCRKRVLGYYLATDAQEIFTAAEKLRHEARHLIGHAEELEAVAHGIAKAVPPWCAREFAKNGTLGPYEGRLSA